MLPDSDVRQVFFYQYLLAAFMTGSQSYCPCLGLLPYKPVYRIFTDRKRFRYISRRQFCYTTPVKTLLHYF